MRVEKPWGFEEILEKNEFYVIKKLFVRKGHRTSRQYHEKKTETWIFPDGTVKHIPPRTVHRLEAKDRDLVVLEVSTPELDDVVRLEDDYGRVEEGDEQG